MNNCVSSCVKDLRELGIFLKVYRVEFLVCYSVQEWKRISCRLGTAHLVFKVSEVPVKYQLGILFDFYACIMLQFHVSWKYRFCQKTKVPYYDFYSYIRLYKVLEKFFLFYQILFFHPHNFIKEHLPIFPTKLSKYSVSNIQNVPYNLIILVSPNKSEALNLHGSVLID